VAAPSSVSILSIQSIHHSISSDLSSVIVINSLPLQRHVSRSASPRKMVDLGRFAGHEQVADAIIRETMEPVDFSNS
jgi:hypothetical protein